MDLLSLHLRLSDLNELVSEVLDQAFPGPFWVIAELASVTNSPAGHTYMDLVEKRGDEVVAQSRAQMWSSRRDALLRFERATNSRLERGMKVLLLAQPVFHLRYGYGLEIRDIDANFTLGDMARRRQEAIERLTDEGLLDRNGGLPFAPAPERIAVISSATAAGWEDFQSRLALNSHGYAFVTRLFPALVQGDGAERSLLKALAQVGRVAAGFDCVILLRGGGGVVDLSCFDSLELGRAIAKFPLPVICGIGHDRDTSVCDLVSYHAAATPTAAAEFLIARVRGFEDELDTLVDTAQRCARSIVARQVISLQQAVCSIIATTQTRVRSETDALHELARRGSYAVRTAVAQRTNEMVGLSARVEILPAMRLREQSIEISGLGRRLRIGAATAMERNTGDLTQLERDTLARDPADVLRRGYSITRAGGRMVRDASAVAPGKRIVTTLYRGSISSIVEEAGGQE